MIRNNYDVIVAPHYTEKCSVNNELSKYTFVVHAKATKDQIKTAFETIFGKKVLSVNVLNRVGKKKVFKGVRGERSGKKLAILTLEKGVILDLGTGA